MKDIKFQFFKKKFILLLIVTGLAGCVFEGDELGEIPVTSDTDGVTFTVHIPGQLIPTTRSYEGPADAGVEKIDLLIFDEDGDLLEHVENTAVTISSQSSEKDDGYKVTFTAVLENSHDDAETVAIVANVDDIGQLIDNKTSKVAILEALVVDFENDKAGPTVSMYGEKNNIIGGVPNGTNITDVELSRMMARIDATNSCPSSVFTLKKVHVVNRNSKGYIAPAWDTDGILEGSLPNPLKMPENALQEGYDKKLTYDYNLPLLGEIYVCEAAATSGIEGNESHTNAICLVLEGTYNGKDYYYRVDFTDDMDVENNPPYKTDGTVNPNFNPSKVKYMPVYRNHLYNFEIIEAEGPGFPLTKDGFEEALNSLGVMNNLKTTLHVVDQSGIKDMVFNGQHFIGLNGAEVTFESEAELSATIDCISNTEWDILGEIEYDYTYLDDNRDEKWLEATKIGNKNINLKTTIFNAGTRDRTAYVYIKAGRLTHKLKVVQNEHVLYVGRFSGRLHDDDGDGVWHFERPLYFQANVQSGGIAWTSGNLTARQTLQGENGDTNGRLNTFNLYRNDFVNPAVSSCYEKNNGSILIESDLKWFLPAQKELMAVYVVNYSFNEYIATAGSHYWTSTESSASKVWNVIFTSGTVNEPTKGDTRDVRCVKEKTNVYP